MNIYRTHAPREALRDDADIFNGLVAVRAGCSRNAGGCDAGAPVVERLLRGPLYKAAPTNVATLLAAAALLLAIAALACLVPALRAARTDPMRTLRGE